MKFQGNLVQKFQHIYNFKGNIFNSYTHNKYIAPNSMFFFIYVFILRVNKVSSEQSD